jgi:ubiquinol-cytochrome c reductase cytochrome b subunit
MLPFYAILRAFDFNIGPIDSKTAGVLAMFASIGVLFVLPWLDTSRVRSMRYRPAARQFFFIFVAVAILLGWCGGQNPGAVLTKTGPFHATLTYVTGGQTLQQRIQVASPEAFQAASDATEAQLRAQHATMTAVMRDSGTTASALGVVGGTQQTHSITADNSDDLETQITAAKAQIGASAPFVDVKRETPFLFTVTRLSQLLTFYYFFFFIVLLPILGLRETPNRVPDTIAKPVLGQTQGAS